MPRREKRKNVKKTYNSTLNVLTEQTQKGMFGQYGIITAKRYTTDIQTQLLEKLKKKKKHFDKYAIIKLV